jgi:hypothetical protein
VRYRFAGKRRVFPAKFPATSEGWSKARQLADLLGALVVAGHDPLTVLNVTPPTSAAETEHVKAPDAPEERPVSSSSAPGLTVAEFFVIWIADKVPPAVRRAQARDYRKHIEKYVLPELGKLPIGDLREEHIVTLRAQLLAGGCRRSSCATSCLRVSGRW